MTDKILLFDNAGRFIEPSTESLAAVTEPERAAIAHIRTQALALDAVNALAKANADALAATQADIAELEKIIPRVTRIDLVKAMSADTQRRRAGI